MSDDERQPPIVPVDALRVPRFAGPATFARLPRREVQSTEWSHALGTPDSGLRHRVNPFDAERAVRAPAVGEKEEVR